MTHTEAKLRERIKELTCLYEVTSIIVNSDYDRLENSLTAIVKCLQKAWQFDEVTEVSLKHADIDIETKNFKREMAILSSKIVVFNKEEGEICVGYPSDQYTQSDFLKEEQDLLNNVCLAVGNLLERNQIKASEAAARQQMQRADRLLILGEITAGVAHELNTPLANILGFAELLKEQVDSHHITADLDKIIDNAIFSREVVKKLMYFANEMPQNMITLELKASIENVTKLLRPSLLHKNISLECSYPQDKLLIRADEVQLTQVLFNLIMNAVYFSPDNGRIEVDVRETEGKIQIIISDEGKGISTENALKIFDPFFTTKPLREGSGLGLSVVHGIMESHMGSIRHEANHPKGTVFIVEFPKL